MTTSTSNAADIFEGDARWPQTPESVLQIPETIPQAQPRTKIYCYDTHSAENSSAGEHHYLLRAWAEHLRRATYCRVGACYFILHLISAFKWYVLVLSQIGGCCPFGCNTTADHHHRQTSADWGACDRESSAAETRAHIKTSSTMMASETNDSRCLGTIYASTDSVMT